MFSLLRLIDFWMTKLSILFCFDEKISIFSKRTLSFKTLSLTLLLFMTSNVDWFIVISKINDFFECFNEMNVDENDLFNYVNNVEIRFNFLFWIFSVYKRRFFKIFFINKFRFLTIEFRWINNENINILNKNWICWRFDDDKIKNVELFDFFTNVKLKIDVFSKQSKRKKFLTKIFVVF